jgi:hypothetical protein
VRGGGPVDLLGAVRLEVEVVAVEDVAGVGPGLDVSFAGSSSGSDIATVAITGALAPGPMS